MNTASAFTPPKSQGHYLVCVPPPAVHSTPYLTGGLQHLYQNLRSSRKLQQCAVKKEQFDHGEYTDQDGCFCPKPAMPALASRYHYVETIGKGQSSILIKAKDTFRGDELVSIKVLHSHYSMLGVQEMDCLRRLNKADPFGVSSTLKLYTAFCFDSHCCLVFELLHPTPLLEYFSAISRTPMALQQIRKVTVHLLLALGFLQQENVLHADLKPENLLLKSDGEMRSVKVVDFGNALHCVYDELSLYYDDFEVQTLLYRAPEVVFGIPFGMEIDMWSVGCILAELYTGRPLFASKSKTSLVKKMSQLLGPLPQEVFQRGKFFQEYSQFTTKNPPQHDVATSLMRAMRCRDHSFADLLAGLLKYNPAERLTVSQAAMHPFLALELPLRFLMPQQTSGDKTTYPRILVNPNSYIKKPHVDTDVSNRHLSSVELLRQGSSVSSVLSPGSSVEQVTQRKVAQVIPLKRETPSPETVPEMTSTVQPHGYRSVTEPTAAHVTGSGSHARRSHGSDTALNINRHSAQHVHLTGTKQSADARDTQQNVHFGDAQQSVHSRDTQQNVHSRDAQQSVHSRDTQQSVHSRDTQQSVHSRDAQQSVHSRDTQQNILQSAHSRDTQVSVHSRDKHWRPSQQLRPTQQSTNANNSRGGEPSLSQEHSLRAHQRSAQQIPDSSTDVRPEAHSSRSVHNPRNNTQHIPHSQHPTHHSLHAFRETPQAGPGGWDSKRHKLPDIMRLIQEEQRRIESEEGVESLDDSLSDTPDLSPTGRQQPSSPAHLSHPDIPTSQPLSITPEPSPEHATADMTSQRRSKKMKGLEGLEGTTGSSICRVTIPKVVEAIRQHSVPSVSSIKHTTKNKTATLQHYDMQKAADHATLPLVPKQSTQAVNSPPTTVCSGEESAHTAQADSTVWFALKRSDRANKNTKRTREQCVNVSEPIRQTATSSSGISPVEMQGHKIRRKLKRGMLLQPPGRTHLSSESTDQCSADSASDGENTDLTSPDRLGEKAIDVTSKPGPDLYVNQKPSPDSDPTQKSAIHLDCKPNRFSHLTQNLDTSSEVWKINQRALVEEIYTFHSSDEGGSSGRASTTRSSRDGNTQLSRDKPWPRQLKKTCTQTSSNSNHASSTQQKPSHKEILSSPSCAFLSLKAAPKKKLPAPERKTKKPVRDTASCSPGGEVLSKRRKVEECNQRSSGPSGPMPSLTPGTAATANLQPALSKRLNPHASKPSTGKKKKTPTTRRSWDHLHTTRSPRNLNWQRVANSEGTTTSDEESAETDRSPLTCIPTHHGNRYRGYDRDARCTKRAKYDTSPAASYDECSKMYVDVDNGDIPPLQGSRSHVILTPKVQKSPSSSESSTAEDDILLL